VLTPSELWRGGVGRKDRALGLGGDTPRRKLIVEGVVPDLVLHIVVPVGDDSVLNGLVKAMVLSWRM
jgi:hypothetical protein